MFQTTLQKSFTLSGIGVHSGKIFSVTICPAEENTGIIFHRVDTDSYIPADFKNVSNATMCTQISDKDGNSIKTIEHLSAALYAMKVSNAHIKVSGEELPILDGSAKPFIKAIHEVGIINQTKQRKFLKILKKIKVTENDKYEELSPSNSFSLDVKCDFAAKGLITSPAQFDFSKNDFSEDIAGARTFGFISDVDFLKKNHLALGASLENTVVYDEKGQPMNEDGLRFENESVKHKLLDVIGDLSLCGYWIQGNFAAFCPSHKLNNILLKVLFSSAENYEII